MGKHIPTNILDVLGHYIYSHKDGRSFRVPSDKWSGGKHEEYTRQGFVILEKVGRRNEEYQEDLSKKREEQKNDRKQKE